MLQSSRVPLLLIIILCSFSCTVHPKDKDAVLFYFPGFGGRDYAGFVSDNRTVFKQYKVDVVRVDPPANDMLYLQHTTIDSLAIFISKYVSDNQPSKIYVGGFSMGGYGCARVLDRLVSKEIIPAGVFIVDAPLNFSRFYHSLQSETTASVEISSNEAKYILGLIHEGVGAMNDSLAVSLTPIQIFNRDKRQQEFKRAFFCSEAYAWQRKYRDRDSTDLHLTDVLSIYESQKSDSNTLFHIQSHPEDVASNPHSIKLFDAAQFFEFVTK